MNNLSYADVARRTLFGISALDLTLWIIVTVVSAEFDAESLIFVGPVIVIPFLAGLALRRWKGKTNALAAVIGILLFTFADPFSSGVPSPTSTIDFTFMAIGLIGGAIVAITATMAFLGRNSDARSTLPITVQYVFTVVIALAVVASIAGGIAWALGDSDITDSDRAAASEIEIDKFEFLPESVSTGAQKLVVTNNDLFRHTYTVEDLGLDVMINPGREALIDITGQPGGTYDVICSIPGHESMEAKLVINR